MAHGLVSLVDLVLAHLLMDVDERRPFFRQHQHAGRFAIEPMHEFQEFGLRARIAQLFDHAERHAAAAMNRDAGGFIDDDQMIVFEQDGEFGGRRVRRHRRFVQLRGSNRRNAHDIAEFQPIRGVDPALVHAHFATAQNAVNVAFWHPFAHTK